MHALEHYNCLCTSKHRVNSNIFYPGYQKHSSTVYVRMVAAVVYIII